MQPVQLAWQKHDLARLNSVDGNCNLYPALLENASHDARDELPGGRDLDTDQRALRDVDGTRAESGSARTFADRRSGRRAAFRRHRQREKRGEERRREEKSAVTGEFLQENGAKRKSEPKEHGEG